MYSNRFSETQEYLTTRTSLSASISEIIVAEPSRNLILFGLKILLKVSSKLRLPCYKTEPIPSSPTIELVSYKPLYKSCWALIQSYYVMIFQSFIL